MKLQLKISHKGLALISIPVLFQCLFVSILIYQLNDAQQALVKELHSKNVMSSANVLGRITIDVSTAAAAYITTKSVYFRDRFEKSKQILYAEFDNLHSLVRDNPVQLDNLRTARQSVDQGIAILTQIEANIDTGEVRSFGGPIEIRSIKSILDKMTGAMSALVTEEKRTGTATTLERERKHKALVTTVWVGVVFNIALAVWAATVFTKSIARRLSTVTDNTLRLGHGKNLNPPIAGTDEIATLDRVFHGMVAELRRAEKMKQYLLAMVSHDLRSPLTSVQGTLTLLAAGAMGDLSEKAQRRVEMAEADVTRLIRLSNDLLEIEKLASGKLEMTFAPTPVNEILQQSANSLRTFSEQYHVTVSVEESRLYVLGDKDRLVQVVVNLLSNAIKYSPRLGTVKLSAAHLSELGVVEFRVEDTGRGIPESYHELIFERFQQVEEADAKEKGGSGLGLAICKSIVTQHEGKIGVNSQVGKGSTFWFRIKHLPSPIVPTDADDDHDAEDHQKHHQSEEFSTESSADLNSDLVEEDPEATQKVSRLKAPEKTPAKSDTD